MRIDPKECRASAVRCAKLAAETEEPRLKRELEQLAANWMKLAVELERTYFPSDWGDHVVDKPH